MKVAWGTGCNGQTEIWIGFKLRVRVPNGDLIGSVLDSNNRHQRWIRIVFRQATPNWKLSITDSR